MDKEIIPNELVKYLAELRKEVKNCSAELEEIKNETEKLKKIINKKNI